MRRGALTRHTLGARTTRGASTAKATGTTGTTARAARTTTELRARAAGTARGTRPAEVAARTTGTAAAGTAARATRTAWTAGTTRATWTTTIAITAGATQTTRAAATTLAALFREVARRGRELPADTGARRLAATDPLVIGVLLFDLRAVDHAAEATRLRGASLTTETTAAGATTATATAATATTAITAAATAAATGTVVTTRTLRACDAIDHVVKLAAGDRVVRTLLALEHADEPNLVDAITDDVEGLEQALRLVGLHVDRLGDGLDDRIVLGGRRSDGFFGRLHRFGLAALGGRITFGGLASFGGRSRGLAFDGGNCLGRRRRLRRSLAAITKRGLRYGGRGVGRCYRSRRPTSTRGSPCGCSFAKG